MKKVLCILGILILLVVLVFGVGLVSYSRKNDITKRNIIDKSIYGITNIFK